jgi:hypothetical protein
VRRLCSRFEPPVEAPDNGSLDLERIHEVDDILGDYRLLGVLMVAEDRKRVVP